MIIHYMLNIGIYRAIHISPPPEELDLKEDELMYRVKTIRPDFEEQMAKRPHTPFLIKFGELVKISVSPEEKERLLTTKEGEEIILMDYLLERVDG